MVKANPQQKGKCSVRMDDLEWDSWMGTEVGQLGGHGFQGEFFGKMGHEKMARWVQGAVNSRGKRQTNVHEAAEKRKV